MADAKDVKPVGSMHWSDEEAKLMKAIFTWEETEEARRRPPKPDTVGELRILVIGAKGTGKTSILTRVRPLLLNVLGRLQLT